MAEQGVTRRLAAVLAADIVGYTRLMEQDTDGTVAAWHAAREDVIDPCIAEHAGRIVKHTGDGFLAEFPSVQNAVKCAVTMQEGLAAKPIDFRMGVNLGDIIDDGEDIHGEGVNIAARIESLAEPGGVCVSGDVHNQVRNRLELTFDDLGDKEVKHVSRPVRVYAIRSLGGAASAPDALAIPDKPSIAVLPFDNMSNDPEQEYFSDGITEDVTTELSKISGLFVIARHSAFTYKGKSVTLSTGRPRTRRALRSRGQRAQVRQPSAHYSAAYRCRHRSSHVGRPVRSKSRGRVRRAGRGCTQRRCRPGGRFETGRE